MSTADIAQDLGEPGLAKKEVDSVYKLVSLLLAKYGMIGIVCAYFGWMNWQQHNELLAVVRSTVEAANKQTEAVNSLTKAVERMDANRPR